jgi:hypothetical protein
MNKRRFIWGGIAAVVVGGLAVFNVSLNSQGTNNEFLSLAKSEALATVECTTTNNGTNLLTVCTGRHSTTQSMQNKKYCTASGGACSYSSNGTGS